ncbi:Mu transposase C-terminal domain-containing protein [Desulfallas sp. Bu1-1]|nr:Mu transposase C-terminal domain-containing protein [Desulfallas sp. Bu1-1]
MPLKTRNVQWTTGCISLTGNTYEVDLELVGQRVLLHYDPFDLTQIQV